MLTTTKKYYSLIYINNEKNLVAAKMSTAEIKRTRFANITDNDKPTGSAEPAATSPAKALRDIKFNMRNFWVFLLKHIGYPVRGTTRTAVARDIASSRGEVMDAVNAFVIEASAKAQSSPQKNKAGYIDAIVDSLNSDPRFKMMLAGVISHFDYDMSQLTAPPSDPVEQVEAPGLTKSGFTKTQRDERPQPSQLQAPLQAPLRAAEQPRTAPKPATQPAPDGFPFKDVRLFDDIIDTKYNAESSKRRLTTAESDKYEKEASETFSKQVPGHELPIHEFKRIRFLGDRGGLTRDQEQKALDFMHMRWSQVGGEWKQAPIEHQLDLAKHIESKDISSETYEKVIKILMDKSLTGREMTDKLMEQTRNDDPWILTWAMYMLGGYAASVSSVIPLTALGRQRIAQAVTNLNTFRHGGGRGAHFRDRTPLDAITSISAYASAAALTTLGEYLKESAHPAKLEPVDKLHKALENAGSRYEDIKFIASASKIKNLINELPKGASFEDVRHAVASTLVDTPPKYSWHDINLFFEQLRKLEKSDPAAFKLLKDQGVYDKVFAMSEFKTNNVGAMFIGYEMDQIASAMGSEAPTAGRRRLATVKDIEVEIPAAIGLFNDGEVTKDERISFHNKLMQRQADSNDYSGLIEKLIKEGNLDEASAGIDRLKRINKQRLGRGGTEHTPSGKVQFMETSVSDERGKIGTVKDTLDPPIADPVTLPPSSSPAQPDLATGDVAGRIDEMLSVGLVDSATRVLVGPEGRRLAKAVRDSLMKSIEEHRQRIQSQTAPVAKPRAMAGTSTQTDRPGSATDDPSVAQGSPEITHVDPREAQVDSVIDPKLKYDLPSRASKSDFINVGIIATAQDIEENEDEWNAFGLTTHLVNVDDDNPLYQDLLMQDRMRFADLPKGAPFSTTRQHLMPGSDHGIVPSVRPRSLYEDMLLPSVTDAEHRDEFESFRNVGFQSGDVIGWDNMRPTNPADNTELFKDNLYYDMAPRGSMLPQIQV